MKSIDDIIIDKITKGKGLNIKSIDSMITEKVSSVSAKGWESLKSTISSKNKKDEQKEEKKEKKEDQHNKKVVDELVLSNDILVDISENTQLLHKAFDDFAKEIRQTMRNGIQQSGGGIANARANSAKGNLPTKDTRKGFDEKDKIQKAIVGEKNPLVPVVLSIKGDTRKIVELLEKGVISKEKKDSAFDLKSLLPLLAPMAGLLGGLLAPELASIGRGVINGIKALTNVGEAMLKNADTLAKVGANVADTVAKAGATATEAIAKNADTVAKAGTSAVDVATGVAKAGAKATQAISDVNDSNKPNSTLKDKAKNAVIGEQKIGKLGWIGAGLGVGGTIRRASEGDTTGAVAEGVSTALPLIFAKTKFGKLANLASLGIDGGLIARDISKAKDGVQPKDDNEAIKQDTTSGASGGGSLSSIASNTAETNSLLREILGKGGFGASGGNGTSGGNGGVLPEGELPPPEQQKNSTAGMLASMGVLGIGGAILAKKTGGLSNVIAKKVTPTVAKPIIKPNTPLTPVTKPKVLTAPPKVTPKVVPKSGVGATAKAVGKGAGKAVGKLIPGVGLVMGTMGAYDKASQGDYVGAMIEGASGVASLIPGLGTVVSAGLTGLSVARDVKAETGDTGTAVGTGLGATALMGGALMASRGVGKLLTKAPTNIANSAGKVSETAEKSSKAIADNAINSGKTIGSSVKDMQGKLANTSKILTNTGVALKSNVEKMFSNVNTQLLKNIAKIGAVGAIGLGVGSAIGVGSSGGNGGSSIGMIGTLGSISQKYESGNRGVGTVSTGKGDHGGVSYGKHQMTADTMKAFLKSEHGKQWAGHFTGLTAGTKAFSDKYKQVASQHGSAFGASQKKYIDVNYFGSTAKTIKSRMGLDVISRGRAVQELVYSTAVQYGPSRAVSIFQSALGKNPSTLSDSEIIQRVQNYKANNVGTHFKSSSANVRSGISKRIQNETNDLMSMNNTAGTKSVGANQQTGSISATPSTSSSGTSSSTSSSGASSSNKSSASNADYDLDKICATAVQRAQPKSTKDCAKFVRIALQAGDNKKKIKGGLGHAYSWNKSLPSIGFVAVGQVAPQKGDVAHLPPNKFSKIGHVCIWTGSKWVSDFVQNRMSPYAEDVPYTIYRAKSGYTNGNAVTAGEGVDTIEGEGEGIDAGSEGKSLIAGMVEKTGDVLSSATDLLSNGVADIFNSEAMDSVRNFMKGDIYKKGDTNPIAKAQGDFTKDTDEYDEARKLIGSGLNGEKDNLDYALGTDSEILRQQRHENYGSVYGAMTGTTDIQRQQRHDDYNKVKDAIGGTSNIQRQMGGKNKNKWWYSLFDGAFGGNNLLSGLFGLATGQRKLEDLTPQEIAGMIEGGFGEGGLFNGGGKQAIGKAIGLDASADLAKIAGGGFGGGINSNFMPTGTTSGGVRASGDFTNDLSQIANVALGGRLGSDGSDILSKGMGQVFGNGTMTDKANGIVGLLSGSLQNEGIANALGDKLGMGSMGGMVMNGIGGLIGGLKFVSKDNKLKQDESRLNFDPTESGLEDSQMQMAKYYKEEADAKKFDVSVNVPQPVKTPTTSNPRGKSTHDGLGGSITVKNPDTIIHTVAVTMMSNSV